MDRSWTLIQERIQMDSMVIKGLDLDTNYQFTVRAVNPHGSSPRSQPSDTIHTTREYCGPLAIQANRQMFLVCSGCPRRIHLTGCL